MKKKLVISYQYTNTPPKKVVCYEGRESRFVKLDCYLFVWFKKCLTLRNTYLTWSFKVTFYIVDYSAKFRKNDAINSGRKRLESLSPLLSLLEKPMLLVQAILLLVLCISRPTGYRDEKKKGIVEFFLFFPCSSSYNLNVFHALVHYDFIFTSANNSPSMQLISEFFFQYNFRSMSTHIHQSSSLKVYTFMLKFTLVY